MMKINSSENNQKFKYGDTVKNDYGRLLTVLVQLDNTVIVKEGVNYYDPKDLIMIETKVDTCSEQQR
jgi:hypothetical protein